MSPISVDIGVPINTTSCPICGSSMEGDQTDRIVEFMRPHLAAERKATVERIRAAVLAHWDAQHPDLEHQTEEWAADLWADRNELEGIILDAEAAR